MPKAMGPASTPLMWRDEVLIMVDLIDLSLLITGFPAYA